MRISNILKRNRHSNKVAVEYKEKQYTYKQIYKIVLRHRIYLREFANSSNNIGIFLPNSLDYIIAYFLISFFNKVIVPLEIINKNIQLCSILKYCEISLIITNSNEINSLKQLLKFYKHKIGIYNLDNYKLEFCGGKQLIENSEKIKKNLNDNDAAIMLHTSGTVSNPKRVMLTHKNLIKNLCSHIKSLKLTKKDKSLIVLPMFFGYCNTSQFLTHFYMGASIVIYEGIFIPKKFLKMIEEKKCTNTTCVPSMLCLVTEKERGTYNLDSLRYLCFGGGCMPIPKLRFIIDFFFKTGIIQTYGQTEASPRITCLLPADALRKIGSVGKPIPGVKVKIINERDKEAAIDEIGEIIVKGSNVMKGYYKQEEETQKTKKNGWLYTGDLGKKDEEGYLYVVGRKKNVIISGGLNIYPEEIEEILISHPAIKEAIVLGESHDILGEVPIAKIVIKEDKNIDKEEILQYCDQLLGASKIPSKLLICKYIEKTKTGKIKRGI